MCGRLLRGIYRRRVSSSSLPPPTKITVPNVCVCVALWVVKLVVNKNSSYVVFAYGGVCGVSRLLNGLSSPAFSLCFGPRLRKRKKPRVPMAPKKNYGRSNSSYVAAQAAPLPERGPGTSYSSRCMCRPDESVMTTCVNGYRFFTDTFPCR